MTLKGKLSSFISACNEFSIFIFNHQDINVKLLVKSLLGGGEGKGEKKTTLATPQNLFALFLCNLLKEPKLGVASAHCLGFPWGWPATVCQNVQRLLNFLFSSLYLDLSSENFIT